MSNPCAAPDVYDFATLQPGPAVGTVANLDTLAMTTSGVDADPTLWITTVMRNSTAGAPGAPA